jgi:hypothetical protein
MQLLKNVGIVCEGVTSPGAFGKKKELAYARAVLDAAIRVNGNPRPFYFLWLIDDELPGVPLWHVNKDKGTAVASVVGCAGDWFGQTGYDQADPDLFITADLERGRLPAVLAAERPCVLVGHWPCFYVNDQVGFKVLKEVKRRLDAYDPDGTKTIWMKTSEIAHYWMARELTDVQAMPQAQGRECMIRLSTRFPTQNFTLSIQDWTAKRMRCNGTDLQPANSRRDFRSGTFLSEDKKTFAAVNLVTGTTTVTVA